MVTRLSRTAHSNFRRDAALYMSAKYADELNSGETWIFNCDKHGKFRAYVPAGKNWTDYVICPRCMEEGCTVRSEAEQKQAFEEKFRKIVGVPMDNAFATFDDFEVRTESPEVERGDKYALLCLKGMCSGNELFDRNALNSMLICGKTGVGKTYLGVAYLRQRFFQKCSCKYIEGYELEDLYSRSLKFKDEIRRRFESYDCLVIDDYDSENWMDYMRIFFANLIIARCKDCKQTVIISNRTKTDVLSVLGDAVVSRLKSGRTITLLGEDRRKTRRLKEAASDSVFDGLVSGL